MSGSLTAGDRKLLLAAGAGSLLLITLSIMLGPAGATTSESPTTYGAGSGGAKAVYLLLHAAGYPVKRWEQSPRDLPGDANATLILAEPEGAPTTQERSALDQFIERGGRVIAAGASGAFFLPQHRVTPLTAPTTLTESVSSRPTSAGARSSGGRRPRL